MRGGSVEQFGTCKTFPPLSSHAVILSYERRKTTRPVISPVYASISLHPRLKGNESRRRRTRLWAWVIWLVAWACVCVCPNAQVRNRFCASARVWKCLCKSPTNILLPGWSRKFDTTEQNRLLQNNIQLDIAARTGCNSINSHPQSAE